eukprot:2670456-Rhodomonas_salina.1
MPCPVPPFALFSTMMCPVPYPGVPCCAPRRALFCTIPCAVSCKTCTRTDPLGIGAFGRRYTRARRRENAYGTTYVPP